MRKKQNFACGTSITFSPIRLRLYVDLIFISFFSFGGTCRARLSITRLWCSATVCIRIRTAIRVDTGFDWYSLTWLPSSKVFFAFRSARNTTILSKSFWVRCDSNIHESAYCLIRRWSIFWLWIRQNYIFEFMCFVHGIHYEFCTSANELMFTKYKSKPIRLIQENKNEFFFFLKNFFGLSAYPRVFQMNVFPSLSAADTFIYSSNMAVTDREPVLFCSRSRRPGVCMRVTSSVWRTTANATYVPCVSAALGLY